MNEIEQLEQAITHLESQRPILGEAVVNTALVPLREKLAQLQARESEAASGPAGERRIVTILFGDVTGSTALAEQLDPEEWAEIMKRIFTHLIEPVERYGGLVARLMGDAILAFFGAPVAHEDDPERAILTGLQILENIAPYRRQLASERGLDFNVRVGINTGLAVVGEIGSGHAGEYTALGDAVNLAARMEQTAAPGTVQIAEPTYRLVASLFEIEPLGDINVKGKEETVAAYRVLGRSAGQRRRPGLATGQRPTVGRQKELAGLEQVMSQVGHGEGQIIALIGEAGLGKSHLIARLREAWQAAAFRSDGRSGWNELGATSYSGSRPYSTFQQQVRQAAGIGPGDTAEMARTKLATLSGGDGRRLASQHIYETLLGLQDEGGDPLVGEAFKQELFAITLESVLAEIDGRPAAYIFDDLQWSDAASLALLGHMLQLTRSQPLLVLLSGRPERQSPFWQLREQIDRDYSERFCEIWLQPLSAADSGALVDELLSDSGMPAAVRQLILERSEGNPFFLEEIFRSLLDQGLIRQEVQHFRWQSSAPLGDINIPANVQALLAARIDCLSADIRRTLQLAAVIGRTFHVRVLEAIGDAADLPGQLRTLQESDLVQEAAPKPEWEFSFRHALTQEAVYRTLLRQQRREYHRRVAQALERLFPDRLEELAPVLAMHFAEAQLAEKAYHYYLQAGESAFRVYANVEAAEFYGQALIFAREIGLDHDRLIPLFKRRGRSQDLANLYEAAIGTYEEMAELGRQKNEPALELAAANALATIQATMNPTFNPREAEAQAKKALGLARQLGDRAAEAQAHWNLLLAYWYSMSDPVKAVEHGEASLAIAREEDLQEQMAFTLSDLGLAYGGVGRLLDGIAAFEAAALLWDRLGNRPLQANNLNNSCIAYYLTGRFEKVFRASSQARLLSQQANNALGQMSSLLQSSYVFWESGQAGRVINSVAEARAALGADPAVKVRLGFVDGILALVYATYGAADIVPIHHQNALEIADQMPGVMKPWHHAALALTELALGSEESAEMHYQVCLKYIELGTGLTLSPGHAIAYLVRCRLALARKAYRETLQFAQEMLDLFAQCSARVFVPDAHFCRGQALQALGFAEEAGQAYREAQAAAEALNSRRILWQILAVLSENAVDEREAAAYRRRAAEVIGFIAESAGSPALAQAFLARPQVQAMLL